MSEDVLRAKLRELRDRWRENGNMDVYYSELADELEEVIASVPADVTAVMMCPRCEGQRYDKGNCGLCNNTGYIRIDLPAEGGDEPTTLAKTMARIL